MDNRGSFGTMSTAILLTAFLGICFFAGTRNACEAAESRDFFKADANKQKAKIEKDLAEADVNIAQNKIQNARSVIDLLEYEYKQVKNNVAQDEGIALRSKIDKVKAAMNTKEDSLVKSSMDILRAQGVDAALQYTKNDLRGFGASEPKIEAVEKKILEEAPAIQQAKEHEDLARAVKALESGQEPDPSTDPYIVRTAKRILQSRADSIKSIADAKARKEMEEKERADRARMDKELKDKKKEEDRLAKLKVEEGKKQKVEEARQKQELARQEKAHKDSLEAQKKQQELQAKLEEDKRKQQLALEAKVHKDSLDALKKQQDQQARLDNEARRQQEAQQKEKDRLSHAEKEQQKQATAQQEKAHKDSLDAPKKEQDQRVKVDEDRRRQEEGKLSEKERTARAEDELQKQVLARQEKARTDSLDALKKHQDQQARAGEDVRRQQEKARTDSLDAVKKHQDQQAKAGEDVRRQQETQRKEIERLARAEEERAKQDASAQEKERRDSVEAAGRQRDQQARLDAERKRQLEAQQAKARQDSISAPRAPLVQDKTAGAPPSRAQAAVQPGAPVAKQQEPEISKSAQDYLAGIRESRKKAQNQVMELYDMLDRKQTAAALDKFKIERKFIGENVDVQVFNTLEQAIMQLAVEMASSPASQQVGASPSAQQTAVSESKEQEAIDRINGLIRDNRVEAAYAEFKRMERPLRKYMPAKDFKLMKDMVENAYKVRKRGG
jgi:hypothetical protein